MKGLGSVTGPSKLGHGTPGSAPGCCHPVTAIEDGAVLSEGAGGGATPKHQKRPKP